MLRMTLEESMRQLSRRAFLGSLVLTGAAVSAPPVAALPNVPDPAAHILDVVAAHYGVSRADILGPRLYSPLLEARQVSIYLMRTLTTHPLLEIGRRVGGRSDTVVLHAIRKIERERSTDLHLRDDIRHLRRRLHL